MINKKSLWFLTLFCLILVLSIYYITMPSELLLNSEDNSIKKDMPIASAVLYEATLSAVQ